MTNFFKKLFGNNPPPDDDEPTFTEEQIAILLESLVAIDAYERVQAASHLGAAREPRAIPGLLEIAKSDMVARFQQQMQDKNADYEALALFNEVARAEGDLKQAAAFALGRIAETHPKLHEEILPGLAAIYKDHRYYYAQASARAALQTLDTPAARNILNG